MTENNEQQISERAQQLLKVLIEQHIRVGTPVGSKTIVESSDLGLSPASVRNVLADLERQGYLASPHTSAGRIPTAQGYRLFVDSLLRVDSLAEQEVGLIEQEFALQKDIPALIHKASNTLSGLTKLAGLVTLPQREKLVVRQIEFLPLSSQRILVVFVLSNDEIENRIIITERDYSPAELQSLSNYLNQNFVGAELKTLRQRVLSAMAGDQAELTRMMEVMLKLADEEEGAKNQADYILDGEINLLSMANEKGVDSLKDLFSAFTQKRDMVHLLDKIIAADGVHIFIGEESGYAAFGECSLVTANYHVEGEVVGTLGVIGPQRMDYERVIPVVDVTAKLLSLALSDSK